MFSSCNRALMQRNVVQYRQLLLSSSMAPQPRVNERKVKVLDVEINLIETEEHGSQAPAIFYLPGAFGTGRSC